MKTANFEHKDTKLTKKIYLAFCRTPLRHSYNNYKTAKQLIRLCTTITKLQNNLFWNYRDVDVECHRYLNYVVAKLNMKLIKMNVANSVQM